MQARFPNSEVLLETTMNSIKLVSQSLLTQSTSMIIFNKLQWHCTGLKTHQSAIYSNRSPTQYIPLKTIVVLPRDKLPLTEAIQVRLDPLVGFRISRVEVKKNRSVSGSSSSILPVRVALNWSSELLRTAPTELPPVNSGRVSPEGSLHVSVAVDIRV